MANVRRAVVPEAADKAMAEHASCPFGDCGGGGGKLFLQIGVAQLRRRPWGGL